MENMTLAAKTLSHVAVVNNNTVNTLRRATVIANRTNSIELGIVKSAMIDELKSKLHNGYAKFEFVKKDGTIREAEGCLTPNLMAQKINGNGINRDSVNTVVFWDLNKGSFRSLRFETLIRVY
jgi:hypothetical protein